MVKCTNKCDDIIVEVMIEVTISEFVKLHIEYMKNRKGIQNYNWYINDQNNLVDLIDVNQSTYERYNYFKYRDKFESSDLYSVSDLDDGEVEVEYLGDLVIRAHKCHNCGEIMSQYIDDANNKNEYTTNSANNWICAGIT